MAGERCLLKKAINLYLITDDSSPCFLVVQRSLLSLTVIVFDSAGNQTHKNI